MDNSLLIVLGATGDLFKKKIAPSLNHIKDIDVVTYSRNNPNSDFISIIGDFDDFSPLLAYIEKYKYTNLYFYFALPPTIYLELIKKIFLTFKIYNTKVALEKPFGTSLIEAQKIENIIYGYGESNFYLVDHYIAKESIINFLKTRGDIIDKEIKSVEISILEADDLKHRGLFFDKVGIVNDTVQSHILLLARLIVNSEINENNFIVDKDSIVLKQFDNYKKITGVDKNSKTETSFYGEFKYKNIIFKIHSAKGQIKNNKYIKLNFSDGEFYKIKIDQTSSNSILPHEYIIKDFIQNKFLYSIKVKDALSQWKIVSQIKD